MAVIILLITACVLSSPLLERGECGEVVGTQAAVEHLQDTVHAQLLVPGVCAARPCGARPTDAISLPGLVCNEL